MMCKLPNTRCYYVKALQSKKSYFSKYMRDFFKKLIGWGKRG